MKRRRRQRSRQRPLHVCGGCGRDFVVPVAHRHLDSERLWIRLRCGACALTREVVVTDAEAQRYDADLDVGTRVLEASLRRVERERMEEDAEAFATALRLDLVGPADFTP